MIDPLNTVVSVFPTNADQGGNGGGDASASQPAAPTRAPTAVAEPSTHAQAAPPANAFRLVVEPTEGGSNYAYKLIDRVTGELVMELPATVAAKISASPDYTAGQVISETA